MIQFLQIYKINGMILILILLILRSLMTMSLDVPLMMYRYISQLIRFARASSHVTDFNNRYKFITDKRLKQGYRYRKLRKAFSKFYRRHFELIEKYHARLKKLMRQGIRNPELYGDLVYKFKKIIQNPNFSDLSKRILNRFKGAGYTLDIMRHIACLVFNPIMFDGYAAQLSCTAVVHVSESMTASMRSVKKLVEA